MSQDLYTQFLRGIVTESAAATLTEGTAILTGASVARVQDRNIAMALNSIMCHCSIPEDSPAANGTEAVYFCLSTRSGLAAMPSMDEEHVIYKNANAIRAGVATYLPLVQDRDFYMPRFLEWVHPVLISHAKLYPYVISTNSSAAANVEFVMAYTYVLLDADLAIEALEAYR